MLSMSTKENKDMVIENERRRRRRSRRGRRMRRRRRREAKWPLMEFKQMKRVVFS